MYGSLTAKTGQPALMAQKRTVYKYYIVFLHYAIAHLQICWLAELKIVFAVWLNISAEVNFKNNILQNTQRFIPISLQTLVKAWGFEPTTLH